MTATENALNARALGRKPVDDQVDFYGLTHPGKVRKENQDHFLVSSLHKRMDVHLASLPDSGRLYGEAERLAERLRSMTSAKQVCEDLLQDALDGGDSNNITIIVVRALENDA